jgi:hypothetical protein
MTDILFERFAVLADLTDESDWLDVRRRARRRHLHIVVAAAAAAAVAVGTAGLAATGGWVFSTHDHKVTAAETVSLNAKSWNVSVTSMRFGRLCFRVAGPGSPAPTCTGPLGTLVRARPLGAAKVKVPGGQIWLGATIGFARRVAITNDRGHVYTTDTAAAPKTAKTPFRYWALAVAGTATSITAYDARGHSIRKSLR